MSNISILKSFIQSNGHRTSGYYKLVNFIEPVPIQIWNEKTEEFDRPVMATGMLCEDDVGACGHFCEVPFIEYEGDDCPMSDVHPDYHDALEAALSQGDAGPDKWETWNPYTEPAPV